MRSKVRRSAPVGKVGQVSGAHGTPRLGVVTLLMYADDFLRAAKKARTRTPPFAPAQFYLACHAIELALATYRTLDDPFGGAPRRVGPRPNLAQALAEAKSHKLMRGVALLGEQEMQIKKASLYYEAMVFDYPANAEAIRGYPNAPDIDSLIATASALVDALRTRLRRQVPEGKRDWGTRRDKR